MRAREPHNAYFRRRGTPDTVERLDDDSRQTTKRDWKSHLDVQDVGLAQMCWYLLVQLRPHGTATGVKVAQDELAEKRNICPRRWHYAT